MYQLVYSKSAQKELRRLPKPILRRTLQRIESLQQQPRPVGTVAVKGYKGVYRLRQGDYRIVYEVRDSVLIVLILQIGHRREVYRDF